MSVTRPPFVSQEDGTRCQYDNCGLASHCMAIWRHLEGLDPKKVVDAPWPPTPKYLRSILTPTTCGGTSLNDNFFLADEYYGARLEFRYDIPWSDWKTVIKSGRGGVVRISYTPLHGTEFDHSPQFNGTHQVYVNEIRGDGAIYVADPLATGFAWWPESLLKEATGIATERPGYVDSSFTRDTEGIMIAITDETPKYVDIPIGKWLHFTDGTPFRQMRITAKKRFSPYATKIDGVEYRVIRAADNDGNKFVFLVKTLDVGLRPAIVT